MTRMGRSQSSSSSLLGAGIGGLGALSHAYIQYPPLRCDIPGAAGVMYDDANKLLLVPSPGKVFSWPVDVPPDNPSVTFVKEGPVLGVRFSLDGKILAVQRSSQEIEFINREDCTVFRQNCKHGTERILGIFWADCPSCDVVFVTSSGLELYSLYLGRSGLKFVEAKKLHVSWYVYTHESRLVLLASGMQCSTLSGYQFSAGGIVRLPKFDVAMARAEVNRKPVLTPEDLRIATMYGRLYCLQVDRVAMQLHMYRFYRDAVVPQGSLPIYSGNVALSVVDNVLLLHEFDSKVVLLYDILADPKVPISAPLPLLLRGLSNQDLESLTCPSTSVLEGHQIEALTTAEASIYGEGWVFVNPDIVLDHNHGLLWKIRLDLEAIAASSSDLPSLLGFLQRRRHEAGKAKLLSLEVVRSMIIERRPLPLIGSAMDVLTSAFSRAVKPVISNERPVAMKTSKAVQSTSNPLSQSCISDLSSETMENLPNNRSDQVDQGVGNGKKSTCEDASSSRWPQAITPVQDDLDHGNSHSTADSHARGNFCDYGKMKQTETKTEITEADISTSTSLLLQCPSTSGESSGRTLQEVKKARDASLSESCALKGAMHPLISPEEMLRCVFSAIEEISVDSAFLVAAIVEYLRSAASEHLKVNSGIHVLLIQLLAQEKRYYELWQLIVGKVIPPSKGVAFQLLEVGKQHCASRKLGMEMLRLLRGHTDYVNLLLQEGRLLEGLRYIRHNKVEAMAPSMFLQAAIAMNDAQLLTAVFRFCSDYVPGFTQTTDFSVYSSIINQRHSFQGEETN